MAGDATMEKLEQVSRELAGASMTGLEELLRERARLLDELGTGDSANAGRMAEALRAGSEARLPLIAKRETARSQIQELQQTRSALRSLRAPSGGARRVDLRG